MDDARICIAVHDSGYGFGGAEKSAFYLCMFLLRKGLRVAIYPINSWSPSFSQYLGTLPVTRSLVLCQSLILNQTWEGSCSFSNAAGLPAEARITAIFRNGFDDRGSDWNDIRNKVVRKVFVSTWQMDHLHMIRPDLTEIKNCRILPPPVMSTGKQRTFPHHGPIAGKTGRASSEKFSSDFPSICYLLKSRNIPYQILGGVPGALTDLLPDNVELQAFGAQNVAAFLDSIDFMIADTGDNTLESYGQSVQEAMARGLPVIARDSGNYRSLANDSGAVLMYSNIKEFKQALETLFTPETYNSLSRSAISWNKQQAIRSQLLVEMFAEDLQAELYCHA